MSSAPPLETPRISPLSGEFPTREQERQFRAATLEEWKRRGALVAFVAGVFFLSGFWVDYVNLGINQTTWLLLFIRALFAALTIGVGLGLRRLTRPERMDALALVVLSFCVVATLFIIHRTPVPYSHHALTVFVFVIIFYVFVPTRIWIMILCAGLFSLAFMFIARYTGGTDPAVMIMIAIYLVMGNLLGWSAAVHLNRLRRLQWFNLEAERRARTELLAEVQERKRAEESLRQLASGVAHNFNNSLMAITSNIQAAQGALDAGQGRHQSEAQAFLDNAWRSAATGRDIAQRLSRAVTGEAWGGGAGGIVDVAEAIAQAGSIAWQTWARRDQNVAFRQDVEPGLWVAAGHGEIMEVFQNIFKNSLEALGASGRIEVHARRRGERILIEVRDDGPGIAKELQGRLFKPFASDKGVRGQGLGLAVSKGIIMGLAGDITCRSHPGQGVTMSIDLPAARPPAATRPAPPAAEESAPLPGGRVLLVEDEGLVALGVSAFLRQEGYQVWQARDAAEAAAKLDRARPRVVVSDYGLPDGDAGDIQRAVQDWAASTGNPEPALIVLSGWSEAQLRGQGDAPSSRPFAWLQKPVEKSELLRVLRRAAGGA